jgi:hypothetical protein
MAAIIVSSYSGFVTDVPAGVGFVRRAANRFVVINVDLLRVGGGGDQKNQREKKREFESHLVSPKPADLANRGPGRTLTVHCEYLRRNARST